MSDANLLVIRDLLSECSPEEQDTLFRELRQRHHIHEFERVIGAPAEMILEAIHRAPELTRRMLRGVIADAAFRTFVVPAVEPHGWRDVTPEGNFAYDYRMDDGQGPITVQVKLQRSERGAPAVKAGQRYGFEGKVFMTETQKTRTGTDGDAKTRPYRYGSSIFWRCRCSPQLASGIATCTRLDAGCCPERRMGKMRPCSLSQ